MSLLNSVVLPVLGFPARAILAVAISLSLLGVALFNVVSLIFFVLWEFVGGVVVWGLQIMRLRKLLLLLCVG